MARGLRAVLGWLVVVLVAGVLAGASGGALSLVLDGVQRLLLGPGHSAVQEGFFGAPAWRRVLAPTLGAAAAGLGWWLLRRRRPVLKLDQMQQDYDWTQTARVAVDAVLQVVAVAAGASVGREGAPRQLAAVLSLRTLRGLVPAAEERRVLAASAAGAGLAAVYSTPVAGALFALEVVLGRCRPRSAATALAVSALAVLAVWPVTHDATTYPWNAAAPSWQALLLVLAVTPFGWLVAEVFARLANAARGHAVAPTWRLVPALGAAGAVIGLLACWLPMLPGNGKAIVQFMLGGDVTSRQALALLVVKALVTAMFLRAGAIGGLLTPALAVGAALGTALAGVLHSLGLPAPAALWAITGAAVVLAVSERAAWFAAVFAWELARPPVDLLPTLLAACLLARGLAVLVRRWQRRRRDEERIRLRPDSAGLAAHGASVAVPTRPADVAGSSAGAAG